MFINITGLQPARNGKENLKSKSEIELNSTLWIFVCCSISYRVVCCCKTMALPVNEILAQLQESSDDEVEEDEEMGDNDERGSST